MGKRGPKPTPTAKLKLAGSGLVPSRDGEITPPPGVPSPPDWLDDDSAAVFGELTKKMELTPGLLARIDVYALAILAGSIVEYRALTARLAVEGFTTETADGNMKTSPVVTARQAAWTRIAKGFAQFGLSPADRVGLKIEGDAAPTTRGRVGLGGGL